RRALGAAAIAAGVAVVAWRASALGWIGLALSLWLLVAGLIRLNQARTGPTDARVSEVLLGLSGIGVGVVALTWPDATIAFIGLLLGLRAAVLGGAVLLDCLRRRRGERPADALRRTARLGWSVTAFVLTLGLVASSFLLRGTATVTAFYGPPAGASSTGPAGELLRAEAITDDVPDGAEGWRILYRTSDERGRPTVASATVVAPGGNASHPVVAWAHGTTGFDRTCAPSLLGGGLTGAAFPDVLPDVLDRGWAVVATDYPGLGTGGTHPYLIGRAEAYSVLDSVRAARQLTSEGLRLDDRTVAWGHSQGGGAAIWTSQVQPRYAPDVPLSGAAAMAPAADLPRLTDNLTDGTAGEIFASFLAMAYSGTYSDVRLEDVVRPAALPIVRRLATRCQADPEAFVSVLAAAAISKQSVLALTPRE
ncbi:MAG: alpha/beta fold hydrolase, partial [Actinomycetales bacterium]